MSRDYSYHFIGSRYFDFKGYAHDEHILTVFLTDNKVRAAIIIPEHFQKDLLNGRPVHVQTLIDGTFPFRAQTTKGYVTAINAAMNREILAGYLSKKQGISVERAISPFLRASSILCGVGSWVFSPLSSSPPALMAVPRAE